MWSAAPPAWLRCCFSTAVSAKVPLQIYTLPGRYATALYQAASRENKLSAVEAEIGQIKQSLVKNTDVAAFLVDPTINRRTKEKTVTALLTRQAGRFSAVVVNLFKVMAQNGRLELTTKVIRAFEDMMAAHRHEVAVCITTAQPLDAAYKDKLKTLVNQKLNSSGALKLKFDFKVEPSILGGMVIEAGDKSIDLSVLTRVQRLNKLMWNTL